MPFQPRIGSATWSRESCERELPLCPRETSTEAWARSCRSSKENRRIRCKATSPFREGRVMNLSIFSFFCLLSRSSPFVVPFLSFIPSKASCSAPSAPPCAARVLAAQLRAPPLRPDAASRPVSLFFFGEEKAFGRGRTDDDDDRAIAMMFFLFFFLVQFDSSGRVRPCSGFELDLLSARGWTEKRTNEDTREKTIVFFSLSQRRLPKSHPNKKKNSIPTSRPRKKKTHSTQTPTARRKSPTPGSPRPSPPSGRRSTPSSSSWAGGRSLFPRR